MKKILLLVFLIVSYYSVIYYIDISIETRDKKVYSDCKKSWSSRGLYTLHSEQNSLKSVNNAFQNGYIGVEVDFYYDVKMNKFILSHNKPKLDQSGQLHYNLKNGKILTLEELFRRTGSNHYFWLDYKNLDRLSYEETDKAIKKLNIISKYSNVKERMYIEGSTPFKLSKYKDSGFNTIFAFSALPENNFLTSISSNVLKIIYYYFGFSSVAMPYGKLDNPKYNHTTQENLKGIPTFLFHVPDEEALLEELVKKDDVRVMLIGRDKSINRSNIINCSKEN